MKLNITASNLISNLGVENTEQMIQLVKNKSDELYAEMEKIKENFLSKQREYDGYIKTIEMLKAAIELQSNLPIREGYSREWKWPTKTLFILKQIKRPLTAKEVIRSIEIYEGQVPEDKKTAVFTALTNLTKENKIVREKPGAEYMYSMPKIQVEMDFSNELEIAEEDLSK